MPQIHTITPFSLCVLAPPERAKHIDCYGFLNTVNSIKKKHFQINLLHDILSVTTLAVIIQTPSNHVLYVHSVNMAMPRGCEAAAGMGFKPLK